MKKNNHPTNYSLQQINQSKKAHNLAKMDLNKLSTDEVSFIKKHYAGRQAFMGFYTDQTLSKFMYNLLNPHKGSLLDPCCGTGRLIENVDFNNLTVTCFEIDRKSALLCDFFYSKAKVVVCDALLQKDNVCDKYDYFIANPPWGLRVSGYENYSMQHQNIENCSTALFLELCISALKGNGLGVIAVPSSFFTNDFALAYEYLVRTTTILAKINFPSNAFYNSNILVSGSILLIYKGEVKNKCFEYTIYSSDWNIYDSDYNEALLHQVITLYKQHVSRQFRFSN